MPAQHSIPVVLCFSGLDSTGGAGLQADIEAILSMGCHAAPVATALTIQDTSSVKDYQPVDASWFEQQARTILLDMPVAAIKIGMLAEPNIVKSIINILKDFPDIPVVLDPVLSAGSGGKLSSTELIESIVKQLLPYITLITPNVQEAKLLSPGSENTDECARFLMQQGCANVLITAADESTEHVDNRFYSQGQLVETFTYERLPHQYHGSGCTLAASAAALLAQGLEPFTVAHEAQEFTWESLQHAYRIGNGQWIPNRLFWAREDEAS
jgi:hydroxymethylpyrimidine/phosphomethylpyrimidine kinase